VGALRAALEATAVEHVVLAASGSPYVLEVELALARNVTLEAESDSSVVLDASASATRLCRVLSVGLGASVELRGLWLTGGWTAKGGGFDGGAIGNYGRLVMRRCEVFGNAAYIGGGVFNRGELEVFDSSLRDNVATVRPAHSELSPPCKPAPHPRMIFC
jgi:hypothetical protein